jgi:hypothetical protein
MIKLMNSSLYSYSAERERTSATAIPPLSPSKGKNILPLPRDLNAKDSQKLRTSINYNCSGHHHYSKRSNYDQDKGKLILSYDSTVNKGIPIRKKRMLFVMKPR